LTHSAVATEYDTTVVMKIETFPNIAASEGF